MSKGFLAGPAVKTLQAEEAGLTAGEDQGEEVDVPSGTTIAA